MEFSRFIGGFGINQIFYKKFQYLNFKKSNKNSGNSAVAIVNKAQSTVWPEGGIYPVLRDFWRWGLVGFVGLILKRGDFGEFPKKTGKMSSFDQKSGQFCIKNLKIFPLKIFPKKKWVFQK